MQDDAWAEIIKSYEFSKSVSVFFCYVDKQRLARSRLEEDK